MKKPILCMAAVALLAACQAGSSPQGPRPVSAPNGQNGLGPDGRVETAAARQARVGFALTEAPMSLTAGDGTGLKLAALKAKAIIDGPLAFTEMQLAFENPNDRVLEGTFRIALPRGASLGRFAMKIDGQWQEGEVVELEQARRAYEDFLHRKQDPALMEKAAGNEFSARVFPIPARGVKEIVVSYVEEVKGEEYKLPLHGLPEIGEVVVEAKVLGATQQPHPFTLRNAAPSADFAVPVAIGNGSVRSGELAILRVKPQAESRPDSLDNTIVLVDTSASRVLGFGEEMKALEAVMRKIGEENGSVTVAAFDQVVTPIYAGKARAFGAKELGTLRDRDALGASDIERALGWAKTNAKGAKAKRVVLVSDGVATAGATDPKALLPKVSALKDAGIERLDAIAVGGIRDEVALGRLVRGTLPHDGVVAEATETKKLGEATRSNVAVKVEGATWSWPTKLDGVQSGDTYSIYAEVPVDKKLVVSVGGGPATAIETRKTERPLLERAVAQARVANLLEREVTSKESLKKSIVSIAVRQRIMTPYTAMLVLETEQDYARYGIDRRSLADVLAIDSGGVQRVRRTATPMAKVPLTRPDDADDFEALQKSAMTDSTMDPSGAPADRSSAPAASAPRGGAPPPRPRSEAARGPSGNASQPSTPAVTTKPAPRPPVMHDESPKKAEAPQAAPAPAAAAPPPPPRAMARPAPEPEPEAVEASRPARAARRRPPREESFEDDDRGGGDDDGPRGTGHNPYEGKLKTVMDLIKAKQPDQAMREAMLWRAEAPGDVLALVALGEAAEAKGQTELAARAYGSVIDLFSNRADLRRFAGERLERLALKDSAALDLAVDTFEKAVADRPDHPASHRLLAYALVRKKQFAKAFEAISAGAKRGYEVDRYAGVDRILREDVGLVGAAWARNEPARKDEILAKVRAAGGTVESGPSLRFVLNWETDANDVDFHIHDGKRGHAFFSQPHLRSGGDLYADVTTGYGPECFTIRSPKAKRAGPYVLEAHYYSRGPMGYGMGKLEVIEHDGNGNLTFDERPFIVMVDQAFVDLGSVP